MNSMYVYALANLGSIFFPLAFSFERKVHYAGTWKALFPALCVSAAFFIVWDSAFTQAGVWGFNEKYISGKYLFRLPVEEILFFFAIPFSSIFIYRFLQVFWPKAAMFTSLSKAMTILFLTASVLGIIFFYDRAYTVWCCSLGATWVILLTFVWRVKWIGAFYRFYFWHLIPFFIVNGLLTGTGLAEPVVWYNNAENSGFRMGTIPAEDLMYSFSLMAMNITLYEYFLKRFQKIK